MTTAARRPRKVESWVDRLPRCPASGKRRHPSEVSAEAQLAMVEEARGADPLLNTYQCDACHDWHVGRSSPHLPPRPRRGHR